MTDKSELESHGDEVPGRCPCLWIVVPCYNEEAVLPLTAPHFLNKLIELIKMNLVSSDSRICFVNDGSSDKTWELIQELAKKDSHYVGVSLSRNRGHQNALLCGLMEARSRCDISISIDCDGQDDINAMDEMVRKYLEGYEIVYGVRDNRETDSAFKRNSAQAFYGLMRRLGADTVYNHADYRLLSSLVLDYLAEFREVNLFLRGLVPLVGFPATQVTYRREKRMAGESHYPLRKMVALAVDGITSLSIEPIHIISGIGIVFGLIGLVGIVWAVAVALSGHAVQGWTSMVCAVLLVGGINLVSMGVIGEYVGKTYLEAKGRPRWIVAQRTWDDTPRRFRADSRVSHES